MTTITDAEIDNIIFLESTEGGNWNTDTNNYFDIDTDYFSIIAKSF